MSNIILQSPQSGLPAEAVEVEALDGTPADRSRSCQVLDDH